MDRFKHYNTEVLNLKFGYKALYTSGVLNWKSKCTAFEYIRLSNKSGGGWVDAEVRGYSNTRKVAIARYVLR